MRNIEIRIPYRFGPWRWTKTLRRQFASSLNDLSTEQLLNYCHVVGQNAPEGTTKINLLMGLYRIPFLLLHSMSRIQAAQLTLYLNPLLEKPRLTEQKLPVLKARTFWQAERLFGPGSSFKYLRLGEFMAAHQYFESYQHSGQPAHLDMMMACLYRPTDHKEPYGDPREPFREEKILANARLTASLPDTDKVAIYYYFAGCYADLAERYDLVFSADSPEQAGSRLTGSRLTGSRLTGGGDWMDLIRTLPNDKFGTLDEIEQLYVHVVFDLMNRMMKDQQKTPK